MDCSTPVSLSITNSQSLLKLTSIESVIPSNHLVLCRPLLLPSILPSIRVFSNESVLCIKWPKYWSLNFSISLSKEYSGLISFRIYWFDLFAVLGTLKSLLKHHSSKSSVLQHSAFLIVQLSHPYKTNGKTIALTRWTFVGKVMSLLFNMLSRLVVASLPRSKCLLISWLQSPSTVILEPKKIKSLTVSIAFPSICHEVMGLDAMILVFWMLSFKPTFSLSSFTFINRLFSSFLLFAIRVVSSAYLTLLLFLPAILIPACASMIHPKFSLGAFPLVLSLPGKPFSLLANPLSFSEPSSTEKEWSLNSVLCSSPSFQLSNPFFSPTLSSPFSTMGILLSSS